MAIVPIMQITREYIFFEKPGIELISLDLYTSALQASFNARCEPSTTNLYLGIKWTVMGKHGKKYEIYSSSGLYVYANGDIRAQTPVLELVYNEKRKNDFEAKIQKAREELLLRIKLGVFKQQAVKTFITDQELYNALCTATPDNLKSYERLYGIALSTDHTDPVAGLNKLINTRRESLHMYAGSLHYVKKEPTCLHMAV